MATLAMGEIDAEKPLSALSWIRAKRCSVWPIKNAAQNVTQSLL